jgi:ribonuclease P protein component
MMSSAEPAPDLNGQVAPDQSGTAAAGPGMIILRKRADFLLAAQARRQGTSGFLLQARARTEGDSQPGAMRVGFTCSKKIGNAVTRNRAKRRLRALARDIMPELGRAGWDYVLVGRPQATTTRSYADMLQDLRTALGQVHKERRS